MKCPTFNVLTLSASLLHFHFADFAFDDFSALGVFLVKGNTMFPGLG